MSVLSNEDKVYLRRMSRYVQSLGKGSDATIDEFYYDETIEQSFNKFKRDVSMIGGFTNIYGSEIPPGYLDLIEKVLDSIDASEFYIDTYEVNSLLFQVTLDSDKEDLYVLCYYYYNVTNDSSIDIDEETAENMITILEEEGIEPEDRGMLHLDYNGGGDSGYINHEFSNGQTVPSEFESRCYEELEESFGGWEIDAGSQGVFVIDFNERTIIIEHGENTETSEEIELFSESFSKSVES